jgi:hypothetical protein
MVDTKDFMLPPPIAGLNEDLSLLDSLPIQCLTGAPGNTDEEMDARILIGVKGTQKKQCSGVATN